MLAPASRCVMRYIDVDTVHCGTVIDLVGVPTGRQVQPEEQSDYGLCVLADGFHLATPSERREAAVELLRRNAANPPRNPKLWWSRGVYAAQRLIHTAA